jgi:hypothetical protein
VFPRPVTGSDREVSKTRVSRTGTPNVLWSIPVFQTSAAEVIINLKVAAGCRPSVESDLKRCQVSSRVSEIANTQDLAWSAYFSRGREWNRPESFTKAARWNNHLVAKERRFVRRALCVQKRGEQVGWLCLNLAPNFFDRLLAARRASRSSVHRSRKPSFSTSSEKPAETSSPVGCLHSKPLPNRRSRGSGSKPERVL